MVEAVGYLGSAGAAVMWLPQVFRILRHRGDVAALAGVSLAAYAVAVVFNLLLAAYGWLSHADPVVLAGCVNTTCAVVIVTMLVRARRIAGHVA